MHPQLMPVIEVPGFNIFFAQNSIMY